LKTLKKEQVIGFYNQFISPESKSRRKLSSQVFGKNHPLMTKEKYENQSVLLVDDIRVFKRGRPLFPLLYTGKDRLKSSQGVEK
jgi:hypothetical protein